MCKKIIFLLVISINCFALVFLEVEVIHEKGLGDKTILKSELMSREIVHHQKALSLKMKNGIELQLLPKIILEEKKKNPERVLVEGVLFNPSDKLNKPKSFKLMIKMNEVGFSEFKAGEGQVTKVKISPKEK